MELSGTSISAAIAAGAAAVLLEARSMTPEQAKLTLQLTSSRVAGSGLIESGAGSLNLLAAVSWVTGRADISDVTTIGGEDVTASLLGYQRGAENTRSR